VVVLGDDAAGGRERMEEEEREKRESGRGVREEEGRALLLVLRGSSLPLLTPGIAYLRSLLLPPGACAPSASSDCITHDIVLLSPSCPSSPRLETSGGGRERDLQSPAREVMRREEEGSGGDEGGEEGKEGEDSGEEEGACCTALLGQSLWWMASLMGVDGSDEEGRQTERVESVSADTNPKVVRRDGNEFGERGREEMGLGVGAVPVPL